MRSLPRRWHARRNNSDTPTPTTPVPQHSSGVTPPAQVTGDAGRPVMMTAAMRLQERCQQLQSQWVMTLLNEQKTGLTPLHQAIIDRDVALTEVLLDAGALVKAVIRPPLSPDKALCRTLFSLGAPDRFKQRFGAQADQHRNDCVIGLALLADAAAPGRRLDRVGAHGLTLAIRCDMPDGLLIKLCMVGSRQYPDLPNLEDATGHTPLSVAITEGKLHRVELLLLLGADPDRPNGWGKPPLQLAIETGRADMFASLLASGARPDHGANGCSLLDLCVQHRQREMLAACQQNSRSHRAAVRKCLMAQARAHLAAEPMEFVRFIDWARPLLTDKQLAKLAVTAAGMPGNAAKLAVLLAQCTEPFPPQQRLPLRAAARASGDPAIADLIRRKV